MYRIFFSDHPSLISEELIYQERGRGGINQGERKQLTENKEIKYGEKKKPLSLATNRSSLETSWRPPRDYREIPMTLPRPPQGLREAAATSQLQANAKTCSWQVER